LYNGRNEKQAARQLPRPDLRKHETQGEKAKVFWSEKAAAQRERGAPAGGGFSVGPKRACGKRTQDSSQKTKKEAGKSFLFYECCGRLLGGDRAKKKNSKGAERY